MRLQWTALRQRLQTSLWTLPALAVALALAGVRVLIGVDQRLPPDERRWYLFGGQAESARELLSTIATSMLTFTALVFSITILVLQLASSQFSPRVIRTFLGDRRTRITLAVFVGSFVFAMALLPEVHAASDDYPGFVPALSVFVAFGLVLVSVGVFIQYVHHMAHAIRAVEVIRRIGQETRAAFERQLPDQPSPAPRAEARLVAPPDRVLPHQGKAGVITHVDLEALVGCAAERGLIIGLSQGIGDFVPGGAPLFRVWGDGDVSCAVLQRHVVIAEERTLEQDAGFGLRQLVDIAERALSPGVNDPTTAVQALDQLHDLLRMLAQRPLPSALHCDRTGQTRLILPAPEWEHYVSLALDEIRQYGEGSLQVMRRLRTLLEDVLTVARPERRPALKAQLKLLDEAEQRGFPTARERSLVHADGHRTQ